MRSQLDPPTPDIKIFGGFREYHLLPSSSVFFSFLRDSQSLAIGNSSVAWGTSTRGLLLLTGPPHSPSRAWTAAEPSRRRLSCGSDHFSAPPTVQTLQASPRTMDVSGDIAHSAEPTTGRACVIRLRRGGSAHPGRFRSTGHYYLVGGLATYF
jgi:hypothetical protein